MSQTSSAWPSPHHMWNVVRKVIQPHTEWTRVLPPTVSRSRSYAVWVAGTPSRRLEFGLDCGRSGRGDRFALSRRKDSEDGIHSDLCVGRYDKKGIRNCLLRARRSDALGLSAAQRQAR